MGSKIVDWKGVLDEEDEDGSLEEEEPEDDDDDDFFPVRVPQRDIVVD